MPITNLLHQLCKTKYMSSPSLTENITPKVASLKTLSFEYHFKALAFWQTVYDVLHEEGQK